jgi:hypothetical protein
MAIEQLTLSDEQVQDIVASLITSGDNTDAVYDDTNDTLTVSLSNSILVNTLEATDSITDASGDTHTGELADKDGDDLTPNTINVATSITDPEGNTVTSLSDPVRVTEETSTFSESNVVITTNKTKISSGSTSLNDRATEDFFPDDFEDGVDSNWTGSTGSLSATTNVVLDGSQSGVLETTNTGDEVFFSGLDEKDNLRVLVQSDTDFGNTGDSFGIDVRSPNGDAMGRLEFDDGGGLDLSSGSTSFSWSIDETYEVVFDYDFVNSEVDYKIDGTKVGNNSINGNSIGEVEALNRTFNDGGTRKFYFDAKTFTPKTGFVSVAFDSGSPSDIDSWDLATFQRTLDNETVTVDVEDSNGNVLKSDISKDTDISDIATSTDVQLRANLSRNDTSNNPTLDYVARRFTR